VNSAIVAAQTRAFDAIAGVGAGAGSCDIRGDSGGGGGGGSSSGGQGACTEWYVGPLWEMGSDFLP
jgi:hypothetical protein